MKKAKNIFHQGAISPQFIAESLEKHQSKTSIGAHQMFMGQVRADEIEGQKVQAIEYSAYEDMALKKMHSIREEVFEQFPITCMHVHHSLGNVALGEICLFVFTSSPHRQAATDACSLLVERIKKELPIWGKEILGDGSSWKVNR